MQVEGRDRHGNFYFRNPKVGFGFVGESNSGSIKTAHKTEYKGLIFPPFNIYWLNSFVHRKCFETVNCGKLMHNEISVSSSQFPSTKYKGAKSNESSPYNYFYYRKDLKKNLNSAQREILRLQLLDFRNEAK
jgi:hypothetical protein